MRGPDGRPVISADSSSVLNADGSSMLSVEGSPVQNAEKNQPIQEDSLQGIDDSAEMKGQRDSRPENSPDLLDFLR